MAHLKTVKEKLATRLQKMDDDHAITKTGNNYKVDGSILLKVTDDELRYGKKRYFPNLAEPIQEDNYNVTIVLDHDTLPFMNSNPINPPKGAKRVYDVFKGFDNADIDEIIIGTPFNDYNGHTISVTSEMYQQILGIDSEERKEKNVRVFNRMVPFFAAEFEIDTENIQVDRNYGLLLKEIIASGEFTQEDLIQLTSQLDPGNAGTVVIAKQINKQLSWLIDSIEEILEEDKLTKPKAKNYGHEKFGYAKNSIIGPEHLMEKILTDFGQYSLFGVPALLNTNKYVIHEGVSRSQFDLILINHLSDIELVELKRPDDYLLEYGNGRRKFYPSQTLSIAIGQLERYITAAYKDNDEEYLIDNKKIRTFINENVGDDIFVESIRPRGLIIMGSWKKICLPYEQLPQKRQEEVSKQDYDNDSIQAYKELKHALKNITLMTYSELLANARTRLKFGEESAVENV